MNDMKREINYINKKLRSMAREIKLRTDRINQEVIELKKAMKFFNYRDKRGGRAMHSGDPEKD